MHLQVVQEIVLQSTLWKADIKAPRLQTTRNILLFFCLFTINLLRSDRFLTDHRSPSTVTEHTDLDDNQCFR